MEQEKNEEKNKEKGLWIPQSILDDTRLSPTEKMIAAVYLSYTKNGKGCYLTREKMAELLHVSLKTIDRTRDKLSDLKMIDTKGIYTRWVGQNVIPSEEQADNEGQNVSDEGQNDPPEVGQNVPDDGQNVTPPLDKMSHSDYDKLSHQTNNNKHNKNTINKTVYNTEEIEALKKFRALPEEERRCRLDRELREFHSKKRGIMWHEEDTKTYEKLRTLALECNMLPSEIQEWDHKIQELKDDDTALPF